MMNFDRSMIYIQFLRTFNFKSTNKMSLNHFLLGFCLLKILESRAKANTLPLHMHTLINTLVDEHVN